MKLVIVLFILLVNFNLCISQKPKKAEVVSLNGSQVYYEVYGNGEPLFLLHGYTGSSKSWISFVSNYAKNFEVYLVDLKGHGKSGIFKERLSIKSVASDVDALIRHLKLTKINAIGYSYGGDVLFQLALLNPGIIKAMISIGACGSWNAKDYPDWLEYVSYKNINNLPWMRELQTDDVQIKAILDQFPNYNISVTDREMKSIQAKTLFVLGDQDTSIPLECISSARKSLSESYFWMLPNTGHNVQEGKNKPEFMRVSESFFKENWTQKK